MPQVQELNQLSQLAQESLDLLTDELKPGSDQYERLEDIRERFKIWSGNIGALHAARDPKSLGYRVRAAPKLKARFQELLSDVREDLDELEPLLKSHAGREHDGTFDTSFDSLIETLNESIRTLFKTSGIARKAVTRDRYALALAAVSSSRVTDESVDFERIGDLFPRLCLSRHETLRERLAKANNHRRRYLQYCQDHQASVLGGTPATGQDALSQRTRSNLFDVNQSETSSQAARSTATTVHAARFDAAISEQDDSESIASAFSYATDSANPMRYRVIDLQDVNEGREYFVCPYCRKEQCFTSQGRWKKHVLSDIKAYVCLDEECNVELFDTSRAWMNHQLGNHLLQRICPYCDSEGPFRSLDKFEDHLRRQHPMKFHAKQLSQISKACERNPVEIQTSVCLFCDWKTKLEYQSPGSKHTVSLQRFRRHVGSHLEQAALAVLNVEDTEGSEDDEYRSDEALMMNSDMDETSQRDQDEVLSQGADSNLGRNLSGHDNGGTTSAVTEADDLDPNSPEDLKALEMLSSTYCDQEKWDEAEELDVRMIETKTKMLGKDHPDTLTSVNNLAWVLGQQGKYEEAEEMFRRALEGREKVLGKGHPDTLVSVNNLAAILEQQGKYEAAEEMYMRALTEHEEAYGPNHKLTLETVNRIGILYNHQGKMKEAEEMYVRALKGVDEKLGPKHPSTLMTVSNLGDLYRDQGDVSKAKEMYERAADGFKEAEGDHDKLIVHIRERLSRLTARASEAETE